MLSEWQVFKANSKNWTGGSETGFGIVYGTTGRNLKRRGEA
jgi:hypothetical protein